jgi:hypothetical protein
VPVTTTVALLLGAGGIAGFLGLGRAKAANRAAIDTASTVFSGANRCFISCSFCWEA